MPSSDQTDDVHRRVIGLAYTLQTGVLDWLSGRAVARGWTPAILPYPGYAGAGHARVLCRVVLAPAQLEPSSLRGISGFRRLLTLEYPGAEVTMELEGTTTTLTSDGSGIIDARIALDTAPRTGTSTVSWSVSGRAPVRSNIHVANDQPVRGVVCDIDDTVWITGLAHPLRAAWRTLSGSSSTRRSVPGMSRLLASAIEGQHEPPIVYLSNGPWNFVGPVTRFLDRNAFPAGTVLMTDWGITPTRWFRDGKQHKASSLARLVQDFPHVSWVLIGDDGEHDPVIYADMAEQHPGKIDAIALRKVTPPAPGEPRSTTDTVNEVPVLRGVDGDTLLPLLRDTLTTTRD